MLDECVTKDDIGGVMEDEQDDPDAEYQTYFEGPCTCEHDPDDHGWGECGEGECQCQAGWCE